MKNKRIAVLLLAAMLTVSSWPGPGAVYAAEAKQSSETEQTKTEVESENGMDTGETKESEAEEPSQQENVGTENNEANQEATADGKNTEDIIVTSEEAVDASDETDSPEKHSDTPVEVSSLAEVKDLSIVTYHENDYLHEPETRTWDVPLNIEISEKSQPFDSSSWKHVMGGVEMLESNQKTLTYIFNKPVNITIDNCQGTELQLVRRNMTSTFGRWIFNAPVTFTVKNSKFDYIQCMQVYNTGGLFYSELEKNWGVEMNDTYTINIENCQKYTSSFRGIELIGGSKKMADRDSSYTGLATEVWKTGVHKGLTMNVKDTDVYSLTAGHYIITGKDQTNPDFFMEGPCEVNLDNSNVLGAFESSIGMVEMKDSLDFDGSIYVKLMNGSTIRTFYSEGTVYTSGVSIGKTTGGTTLEFTEPGSSITGMKGVDLLKVAGRVDVTTLMELPEKGMKIDITNPDDWNDGDVILNYKYTAGSRPAVNQTKVSNNWNNPNLILGYKDENSNQVWYLNKNVTVTFDSDGGTDVASQTVKQGTTVTEPTPAPTKKNSIFEGWYTDKTYATKWTFTDPVNQDMTLYAKWKAETADVKISEKDGSKDYGTVTVNKGTPITSDKIATLPVTVEKKGYTVEKWVTSDGQDWDIETDNVTANMEIHPVWKLNDPEVNLSAEGNVTKVHVGDSVKLIAEAIHEAEGNLTYQFKWYKDGEELELKKSDVKSKKESEVSTAADSNTNEITVDEAGKYSVKVIATDAENRSSAEEESNAVDVEVTPHDFSGDWEKNEKDHWHVCTIENCEVTADEAAHTFGEWTVEKAATKTEEGVKVRSCDVCGYQERASIPVLSDDTKDDNKKDDGKKDDTINNGSGDNKNNIQNGTTASTNKTAGKSNKAAKTGDVADLGMWAVVLMLSGVVAVLFAGKKVKR